MVENRPAGGLSQRDPQPGPLEAWSGTPAFLGGYNVKPLRVNLSQKFAVRCKSLEPGASTAISLQKWTGSLEVETGQLNAQKG